MPVEESVTTAGNTTLTRNFVGARGIEAMFLTQGGSTNTSYPLYDVHGNMVATVAKGSSGTSWTIQDERSYDVWGSVRSGAATGGPRGRYCANLGHVQDDESGLVYMRARYYEPGSGRFVSEDPAKDGFNWYGYARNLPIMLVDFTGLFTSIDILISGLDGLLQDVWDAVKSGMLERWAKDKIAKTISYYTGRLVAEFVKAELDSLSMGLHSGGIGIDHNGKRFIHFDQDASRHGFPHVDMQDRNFRKFNRQFTNMTGFDRMYADEFIRGFCDAMGW